MLFRSQFNREDQVRTWTGPGPDPLDPVRGGPGPGPGISGLDLEVQVRGPQNLPGPDPDRTVDSVEVFDPSTVQPSSDNEDINYRSIRLDSDNDESNSNSSEDEGSSRQAIRSNGQAWEVQNNTVETELDTHSHLSDSSRTTTPGIASWDTLSTQSPPFQTQSQRQTILDNLNPPTTCTNSNSIETMFGSNILDYKMAV